MSISSTTSRNDYTGNGATSTYSYSFRIIQQSDLLVTVRDTSDVETALAITTDYTVTGVGVAAGGTIVLVNSGQSWLTSGNLKSGYTITIRRVRTLTQSADIRNQGSYFPETIEDSFDIAMMVSQQQQDEINRSLKLPETVASSGVSPTMPVPSAGKSIRWNSGATALEAYTPADAGELSLPGSNGIMVFTGSLTTTSRTLTAGAGITVTNGSGVSGNPTVAITDLGVTTGKINDLAVTTGKINDLAVTTGKINDLAVTTGKLAAAGVTIAKLDGSTTSQPEDIFNLTLAASVGSNALTVALKTKAGTDPSSSDPVTISFRSSTLTSGVYNVRSVTGALSVVVSSGSTLGHASGVNQYVWVYAIDNAGTVELAVSGAPLHDQQSVITTTAEGGAGAADSGILIYSTTARANVPCRLIGRLKSNQATAGTWATAIAEISNMSVKKVERSEVWVYTANGYGSTNTKIRRWSTTGANIGTAITYADSATNGGSFTINEDGLYAISHVDQFDAAIQFGVSVNSTQLTTNIQSITAADRRISGGTAAASVPGSVSMILGLKAGDVVRAHSQGNASGGTTAAEHFRITKVSD